MADASKPTETAKPAASPPAVVQDKPKVPEKPQGQPSPARQSANRHRDAADAIRRVGGTTDVAADEYAAAGVDPKLDNRTGDQRPSAPPEKPQQIGADHA